MSSTLHCRRYAAKKVRDTMRKLILMKLPRRRHKVSSKKEAISSTAVPMQDLQQSTVEESERQGEGQGRDERHQVEARMKRRQQATSATVQEFEGQPEGMGGDETLIETLIERLVEARQPGKRQPEAMVADERLVRARDFDKMELVEAREAGKSQQEEGVRAKLNKPPLPETSINLSYI